MQTSKPNIKIAAILTCFNRKEKTIACIEQLKNQVSHGVDLSVIVTDDGSTDGTADAISKRWNDVTVLFGDGNLYWTRGMRLAMDFAMVQKVDFIWWVNDDTMMDSDALSRMLSVFTDKKTSESDAPIIVGAIRDEKSQKLTYGGFLHTNPVIHPLRFQFLPVSDTPQRCDVFNGNCVLIPAKVVETIGPLDTASIHSTGDFEYALRARKFGFEAWVVPNYVGRCSRNPEKGTWKDMSLSLLKRYKLLFSTKGIPVSQRFHYYKKHGGPFWIFIFPLVYFRPIMMSVQHVFSTRNSS